MNWSLPMVPFAGSRPILAREGHSRDVESAHGKRDRQQRGRIFQLRS